MRMRTHVTVGGRNMRRLWSHIILAVTSLVMVGATFATVVTNIDSNIEYTKGKELVFRIAQPDDAGNPDYTAPLPNDAVSEVAEMMENRLKTAEISQYKVETQGDDTIKVSFVQENEQQYTIIQNYLSFNATLAISNSKGTYATSEEFLNSNKKAYMETTDGYPAIIIPINKDDNKFQAVYTEAKEMNENGEGEVEEETGEEDENGEHEHTHKAYLYLWYNYVEDYYSYDKINQNSSDTYDPNIANKVLMTFDASNPFLDEDEDALRAYVNPSSGDGSEVTAEALKTAYENARYYVNLLNAGKMNYHVSFLFSETADMWVEDLFSLGAHLSLAWSRTFIATLCAVVVVSLLLVYFYRLGALSVATTSIVSTFFGLFFIVIFGAEFSIAGIVGLLSLALTSIVSGVIYLNKLKDECYRGRSLKKANAEAAKKALLPTIDIHVVLVLMGVACYLLGGILMKGFALCTILGGLVSLVLNLLGLRGLLWLVTNEQGLANRYDLFDVAPEQVPNALEEEKQKYYGANADKDFTKAKKPVAIGASVLLLASVACLVVFGVINKGAVYNSGSQVGVSQIYVEYTSDTADNTALTADVKGRLETMLDNSYLNGNKLSTITTLDSYDYTTVNENKSGVQTTAYYAYFRITFDEKYKLSGDETIVYKDANGAEKFSAEASSYFEGDVVSEIGLPAKVEMSLKDSKRVNADQPEFTKLILAVTVASAAASLYLLLRYRLSRGLATLVLAIFSVGITAGLFAMLRFLPVTSYVSVALPFVALFIFIIATLFMNKEREMVLEDRSRDNSLEAREALMKKALGISSTPITIAFIIALYLGVNFFGFMFTSVSWVFLLMILGVSVATALTLIVYPAFAQWLYGLFSKVNIVRPKKENKKKKNRPVRVKKSAEPEEAIFIGIND